MWRGMEWREETKLEIRLARAQQDDRGRTARMVREDILQLELKRNKTGLLLDF